MLPACWSMVPLVDKIIGIRALCGNSRTHKICVVPVSIPLKLGTVSTSPGRVLGKDFSLLAHPQNSCHC